MAYNVTDATKIAWHRLTRLYGKQLILADVAAHKDPTKVAASRVHVVPIEPNERLGYLVQLLFDTDVNQEGNDGFELLAEAAAAAGHPVQRPHATQAPNGTWWRRGNPVPGPTEPK